MHCKTCEEIQLPEGSRGSSGVMACSITDCWSLRLKKKKNATSELLLANETARGNASTCGHEADRGASRAPGVRARALPAGRAAAGMREALQGARGRRERARYACLGGVARSSLSPCRRHRAGARVGESQVSQGREGSRSRLLPAPRAGNAGGAPGLRSHLHNMAGGATNERERRLREPSDRRLGARLRRLGGARPEARRF